MECLDLHLGHVDARWTLAPTSFAAHAEVERRMHLRGSEALRAELAGQREAQRVGTPARDVLLVARRAVARAHRSRVELAAVSVVVAHLDGLREALGRVAAG